MNRQIMRVAVGANLVAGCLLLQGCGMFGKPKDHTVTQVPDGDLPPVEVQTLEPAAPVETMPVVETAPAVLPTVPSTTPYTIQKGDTISSVAYKYSLRWQDVVAVATTRSTGCFPCGCRRRCWWRTSTATVCPMWSPRPTWVSAWACSKVG